MSDTQSLASEDAASASGHSKSFVEVEECGKLTLDEISSQAIKKSVVILDTILAVLFEDGNILLGEIKQDRSANSWNLLNQTTTAPLNSVVPGGGRYLDLCLVRHPNTGNKSMVLVLLGERKNKERFLSSHLVSRTSRGVFEISEETSVYDKSNVLGKGISHLASDQESIFTVSNLVRKIKLELGGSEPILKPTSARAQVPSDCLDGTLSLCALTAKSKSKHTNVVLTSKTKSAGKNKYGIEWYTCNKKDELNIVKSASSRINEDSEPVVVLSCPKDGRSMFVIFNSLSGSSSLHKITKTNSDGPLATFNFAVSGAAFGWINELLTLFLMVEGSNKLHVYSLHKTDGHRTRHPGCASCPVLENVQSPSHVVSCSMVKWRLPKSMVDEHISTNSISLVLASLFSPEGSPVVEPELGLPYRVRILNCPIKGLLAEAILLEDLERCFDGDFSILSKSTLRVCLSFKPSVGAMALFASWVKSEKVSAIELYYVKTSGSDDLETGQSIGISVKAISTEKFSQILVDNDWTHALNQRPSSSALMESTGGDGGTFTLDNETNGDTPKSSSSGHQRPMSASVCSGSSRYGSTRIPMPKSSTVMSASAALSSLELDESGGNGRQEDLEETNARLRGLVARLAATLSTILDVDVALRNNLMTMHECITEVQEELAPKHLH